MASNLRRMQSGMLTTAIPAANVQRGAFIAFGAVGLSLGAAWAWSHRSDPKHLQAQEEQENERPMQEPTKARGPPKESRRRKKQTRPPADGTEGAATDAVAHQSPEQRRPAAKAQPPQQRLPAEAGEEIAAHRPEAEAAPEEPAGPEACAEHAEPVAEPQAEPQAEPRSEPDGADEPSGEWIEVARRQRRPRRGLSTGTATPSPSSMP